MKQKQKQMKHSANQTPIYHAIERLLDWCMPVVERLPKSLPYQRVGTRVIDKTLDALDLASLSYDCINDEARANYLGYLITDVRTVRASLDVLVRNKCISQKQQVAYIDLTSGILAQAAAWQCKGLRTAND